MNRVEVMQLAADAERAATNERERRVRLTSRGRQAVETGRKIVLFSMAGAVGVALIERLVDAGQPQVARAEPKPRKGILVRVGMLVVALLRWSSVLSRAWGSLKSRHSRMAEVPASAGRAADA